MKMYHTPSYRERKTLGKKRFKKRMALLATGVVLASLGGVSLDQGLGFFSPQIVVASEIKNGTQIGTLNGVPVVKSQTADMGSKAFQDLVNSLTENTNLDKIQYVADKIQWNDNTEVKGVGGVQAGRMRDILGTTIPYYLGQDGFTKDDTGAYLNPGQSLAVTNVGTVTNIKTGEKIPVDLIITHVDVEHGDDGWTNKDVAMAIKNQGSVITVGVAVPTGGRISTSAGGRTEDGGVSTGAGGGVGRAIGFINRETYVVGLVRQDTKQVIPNEEILMAMKVSDIDAKQLAVVDKQGALGYIVGPDTDLSVSGEGLVTGSSKATNTDSTQLLPTAYVALKAFNSNAVSYSYTDGANNHFDIVTGLFGNTGFTVNADTTGSVVIQKEGLESHDKMWNTHYSLKGNVFRLTDKQTGKTYEGTTDDKGKVLISQLPFSTYTLEEVTASSGFAKTFTTQEITLTKETPKQTIDGKEDQLVMVKGNNDEVQGQNQLIKEDKDTQQNPQGQASLKEAEYTLYYGDTASGASPHEKDTPVKWTDIPNAILLKGEKVRMSIVNGKAVDNKEEIVLKLDAKDLSVAVGNLSLGKYYWKESNAPEGYAIDAQKHEFEITKKDDVTQTILTPNTKSLEQVIQANVTIQKIAQSSGDGSSSGINDIEFTATPINGTKGNVVTFKTSIVGDEDGLAKTTLTYGDYKIEETKSPDGYEKIDPIYIHMSYDAKTDLYTITASKNEDGSKPFSTRTFSQSDGSSEANTNVTGSLAGTLSSSNFTLSLSKLTFKDNATPPKTPEKPTFQPEKFDLSQGDVDLVGTKLLDDDDEVTDEYTDIHKDPYVDKTDNNEPQNLNTKMVKRGDTIFYQVWLDTSTLTADQLIQVVGGWDDYDEKNLTIKGVKTYDGKTGEEASQLFDVVDKDGKLTFTTKKDLVKDNVLDTTRFAFGRYYKFVIEAVVKEDAADNVDILNTAGQFVTPYNPTTKTTDKPMEKPTQKRVNKVRKTTPEPHKFVLKEAGFDTTGTKLLDDDGEVSNRYVDTNKDPYVDKTDNNESQNINTQQVQAGETIHYQVWMDTTPFDKDSLLQTSYVEDDYDERYIRLDIKGFKAYNKATGKVVTDQFEIVDQNGKVTIIPKASLKKTVGQIQVIDTSLFDLGVYYQFDIPAKVKEDVPQGVDIVNSAKQIVIDHKGKQADLPTEKRVNKTPKKEVFLPNTGDTTRTGLVFLGLILLGSLLAMKIKWFKKKKSGK